ncbi:hypothetical protein ACCS91_39625, partial [Rhizobium ruizarguesonis]
QDRELHEDRPPGLSAYGLRARLSKITRSQHRSQRLECESDRHRKQAETNDFDHGAGPSIWGPSASFC